MLRLIKSVNHLMSTPLPQTNKPTTRSANKKQNNTTDPCGVGGSPVLQPAKRKCKSSVEVLQEEPLPKRMAENQILEAINGLKTSMTAMEQELRAAPTKTDFNSLVTEIRSVKENVIRNKDHIDTLYDLRKSDAEHLTKRVEKMIDNRIASSTNGAGNEMDGETGRDFLRCRRSIHLWPIQDSSGLEKGVKRFLTFYLKMPAGQGQDTTLETRDLCGCWQTGRPT